MRIFIILFFALFFSCKNSQNIVHKDSKTLFKVIKIDFINTWGIIYATRNDTLFKIVSKIDKSYNDSCNQVQKGGYYAFELNSRRDNVPEINGIKLKPVNYLDIECYGFDEKTNICIEPKKGIYDLHFAKNLKGLCLEK